MASVSNQLWDGRIIVVVAALWSFSVSVLVCFVKCVRVGVATGFEPTCNNQIILKNFTYSYIHCNCINNVNDTFTCNFSSYLVEEHPSQDRG